MQLDAREELPARRRTRPPEHAFKKRSQLEREAKSAPRQNLFKRYNLSEWRPKTRADCGRVPRPCPFVGCRYNLALEVNSSGGMRLTMVDEQGRLDPGAPNCALDLANRGPMTLDQVATFFGLTRERIRQQEVEALGRLRQLSSLEEVDPDYEAPDFLGDSEDDLEEAHWCFTS